MSGRTLVTLWTAVAVAVFLLGGGIATMRRALARGTAGDYLTLSLTILGLIAAILVAGRIVFVSARAQRRTHRS